MLKLLKTKTEDDNKSFWFLVISTFDKFIYSEYSMNEFLLSIGRYCRTLRLNF